MSPRPPSADGIPISCLPFMWFQPFDHSVGIENTQGMIDISPLAGIVRNHAEIDYDFEAAISVEVEYHSRGFRFLYFGRSHL